MAYGLQILNNAGSIRLDTNDRQVKVHSVYQGTLNGPGASTTVSGITGFDLTDDTWAIDLQSLSVHLSLTTGLGTFTITLENSIYAGATLDWTILILRV